MRILFLGRKDVWGLNAYEHLCRIGADVTAIWSNKRYEALPNSILNWKGDYLFSFYSYYIIPKILLDQIKICINFHPSSPEHAGSGMLNWALYNKEKYYGATAHLIEEKIDSGKILKVKRFKILKNDDINSLKYRAKIYCTFLFYEIIQELLISKKSINNLLETSANENWSEEAKSIKEINAMSKINKDIEKNELKHRIRAFHTDDYPVQLEIHGEKFIHVKDTNYL